MKTLYHYTSKEHFFDIRKEGKLKLTPSNILEPKHQVLDFELKRLVSPTDGYKPVVWLTESLDPERHGLDSDIPEDVEEEIGKKRIRLEIPMDPKLGIVKWTDWIKKNPMEPRWFHTMTNGYNYEAWYITESEIPFSAVTAAYDNFRKRNLRIS